MSALRMTETLAQIQEQFRSFAPHRSPELFGRFLVKGYSYLTLDTAPPEIFHDLLRAKLCLGSLITLYDDFADRPESADPELLVHLYRLNFGHYETFGLGLDAREAATLRFARDLFHEIHGILQSLPHHRRLKELLEFDLQQFYAANHYSSLLLGLPSLQNRAENVHYMHHNMGMIMASSMDLMALPSLRIEELGRIREVFFLGQRLGRICNVLSTYKRERLEKDLSCEIPLHASEAELAVLRKDLDAERAFLQARIRSHAPHVHSFSVEAYLHGLQQVQRLHKAMEGTL